MVHGGGACSGGGGGYSSGVFMSTNNYSHFGNGRGHRNEDCEKCMGGICRCIAVCVCCVGQGYFKTILIFWTWLVVLSLITGLSVGLGRFGPTDIQVSPSDMIQMKRGIDPVLCEGVNVQTTLPVSTYLLPSAPVVTSERVNYSFNETALIAHDRYEYWGFYLIAGSDVDIITCSPFYRTLYIIKGDGQFNNWKNDNTDSDNSQVQHTIGGCSYPQYHNTRISYHIGSTEEYYFVVANDGHRTVDVNILFNLRRAVYDLGGDKNIVCSNSTSCKVNFAGTGSNSAIVVYVPHSETFDFVIKTDCLSRVSVFIAIFLLIPFTVGSLFTAHMLYKKRKESNTTSIGSVQRREQRTFTSYPPEYQTMQREAEPNGKSPPPPYGCHDDGLAVKPPTYEEAVGRSGRV
ncbi:uncharacterized protein LOC110463634 [Mizuhopecten yessoensis]|uniref:E3 ubiquitin-protein ligase APD1-4 middle domain-containing protein n=1 Tax=Mizuhopecten yessoensis TaxID=6573 RepID=A0A210PVP0_MIZYE|nr:uncharacterized protein LOC110463634 [Mizuhopecten yessoensis]OWF40558.1 hypothetical protein KP79_PYT19992 [Mizuhopecten yessoensis]